MGPKFEGPEVVSSVLVAEVEGECDGSDGGDQTREGECGSGRSLAATDSGRDSRDMRGAGHGQALGVGEVRE